MVSIKTAINDLNNEVIIENPNKEGCTTIGELIILLERLQLLENDQKDVIKNIKECSFDSERGPAITIMDIETELSNVNCSNNGLI